MIQQDTKTRRHWLGLARRIIKLILTQPNRTGDLICQSYNRIAAGYDQAWTYHMRGLSLAMLERLSPPMGASGLDLTCGTGFMTRELARYTGGTVIGVDSSGGMLAEARRRHGDHCAFVHADALEYLRSCPSKSVDIITCGWGLGYSRPLSIVRESARVLRPGGRLGIIDNTLFSLAEVLWASMLTFAERPDVLKHVMLVRFLPASWVLAMAMRMYGVAVLTTDDGSKTYHVPDGHAAISRLTATGAAAGFEFATDQEYHEQIFARFAEILEGRCTKSQGVPITHRYLAVTGQKL